MIPLDHYKLSGTVPLNNKNKNANTCAYKQKLLSDRETSRMEGSPPLATSNIPGPCGTPTEF
jgi:hypothetical protein